MKIENDAVKNLFNSWMQLSTENDHAGLQNPITKRRLNEFEAQFLQIEEHNDFMYVSQRIKVNGQMFYSIDKSLRNQRSDFYVSFKCNNTKKFGAIEYFIECNRIYYAVVKEFKVISNVMKFVNGRVSNDMQDLKKKGIFNKYFFVVSESDTISIINCSEIFSKCIYSPYENYILLSEYLLENEHD